MKANRIFLLIIFNLFIVNFFAQNKEVKFHVSKPAAKKVNKVYGITEKTGNVVNTGYSKSINGIFEIIDVQEIPTYPGGDEARVRFIQDKIEYPSSAQDKNIQGTVWIQFIVEIDGRLSNIEVKKAPNPASGLAEEAIRVIKLMPKWIPGRQNGIPCRVRMVMPIKFQLSNN